MKKKKLIIFTFLVIFIVLLVRYGFLIVLWLTTPGDGEMTLNEKVLFEKIKKDTQAKDVWREPKYNMTHPKDTTTYTVVVNGIPGHADTISLKDKAQSIRSEINKLNLHPNFYRYHVLYKSTDGKEYYFKFLR
ncbi:hypothetical protein [Chryseobacterium sp. Leaf394]|uniref:hypothetical protein n=1 Tax=Chryseobacterium sp. Leaf394 TaxID=1736361 RepID=UPI0006FE2A32|nr:hypothetical protein [Chryseobacterium sp. Leaf394]KQS93085.1 hypothetical protein ASG21_11855 [Chryseobacterium sp. Leaf394]